MDLAWTGSFKITTPVNSLADGDKIILPAKALEDLLAITQDLPSPLTFELRNPHSDTVVHGGVKEFSGEVDTVCLPLWMLDALHAEKDDSIVITHKNLPKGTQAKLRSLSFNVEDITDIRATLEAHLRTHYNTLTNGQTLTCRYGTQNFSFLAIELQPAQAVCITDTDLEVDIEPMNQIVENAMTMRLGNTIERVQVLSDQYWYCTLDCSNATSVVSVTLIVESGDADLVASPEREPTINNHVWSDLTSDMTKTICLTGRTSSFIHIGIHAYAVGDAIFSIKSTETSLAEENRDGTQTEEHEKIEADTAQCSNCQASVPTRSFALHEAFCHRHNVLCSLGCGRVFMNNSSEAKNHWHCDQCEKVGAIREKQKHVDYFHTSRTCVCQRFTTDNIELISQHRRATCDERLIICRYCHTLVPQGAPSQDARDRLLKLGAHESYCGSRTIICQACNQKIPIKEVQVHAKIHEVTRQSQKLPPLCRNQNCVRPGKNNRLELCELCFEPFREVAAIEDSSHVKLVQHVARKIHDQLTTGCENAWCHNKYCATGSKGPQDANTAAKTLTPLIRPLLRKLAQKSSAPLYICVDETITRKRFLAETLEEDTQRKFGFDWCVEALETEDEDLNRARLWLDKKAPKK